MFQEKNNDIGPRIHELQRYLHRAADSSIHHETGGNITHIQGKILGFLCESKAKGKVVYQKDIESRVCLNKSTVSEIISSLEQQGYLKRVHDDSDGRYKRIEITSEGENLLHLIGKGIQSFEDSIKSKLSEKELAEFFRLIDKIIS